MRAGRRVTVPLVGSERAYRGEGSERAYRGEGEHENQTRVHVATQGRAQQHTGGAASPLLTSGFAGAARHEKEENEQYVWCVVLSLHDFARMLSRRMHSPLSPLKNNQAHTANQHLHVAAHRARHLPSRGARPCVGALSPHTLAARAASQQSTSLQGAQAPRHTTQSMPRPLVDPTALLSRSHHIGGARGAAARQVDARRPPQRPTHKTHTRTAVHHAHTSCHCIPWRAPPRISARAIAYRGGREGHPHVTQPLHHTHAPRLPEAPDGQRP